MNLVPLSQEHYFKGFWQERIDAYQKQHMFVPSAFTKTESITYFALFGKIQENLSNISEDPLCGTWGENTKKCKRCVYYNPKRCKITISREKPSLNSDYKLYQKIMNDYKHRDYLIEILGTYRYGLFIQEFTKLANQSIVSHNNSVEKSKRIDLLEERPFYCDGEYIKENDYWFQYVSRREEGDILCLL